MNNPLVSIVTIVYNAEEAIEQTIRSVIEQTYPSIEYIIIDGGSNDGTLEIIKKYTSNISYWISEPDNGIYDAMNKGINVATGQWINFMNAGDTFFKKTTIQELSNRGIFNLENTIICGNRVLKKEACLIKQKSILYSLGYVMEVYHQACFVPTLLHKKNLFDINYKITGDYDFLYRMRNLGVNFFKVDDYICVFLYGGISSDVDLQFEEVKKVIKKNNPVVKKNMYLFFCYIKYWYYLFHKYFPKSFLYTRKIYRIIWRKKVYIS